MQGSCGGGCCATAFGGPSAQQLQLGTLFVAMTILLAREREKGGRLQTLAVSDGGLRLFLLRPL